MPTQHPSASLAMFLVKIAQDRWQITVFHVQLPLKAQFTLIIRNVSHLVLLESIQMQQISVKAAMPLVKHAKGLALQIALHAQVRFYLMQGLALQAVLRISLPILVCA